MKFRRRIKRPIHPFNRLRIVAAIGAAIFVACIPEAQDIGRDFVHSATHESERVKDIILLHEEQLKTKSKEGKSE